MLLLWSVVCWLVKGESAGKGGEFVGGIFGEGIQALGKWK